MDDKMDPTGKLQADPLDEEIRAIWQPAPAADPQLRAKLLAALDRDPENLLARVKPAGPGAIDLAARRPEGSSRRLAGPQRHAPKRGLSRSLVAAMGAVVLLVGARIVVKSHVHSPQGHALTEVGYSGATGAVDPNELSAEDEQFALGGADDEDSDDAPSVLELAADGE